MARPGATVAFVTSTDNAGGDGHREALPNFLIIGAQKSGTRWLRHNLGCHRSVFTAPEELEFFNHHFDEGIDWYAKRFTQRRGAIARGEATPGYMFYNENPELIATRIEQTLGADVAIVAVLRDPVERARSSYIHHLRRDRIDPDEHPLDHLESLDPEVDPLGIISGGWYGKSLAPFAQRFERLSIEFHADIHTAGEALFVRVLEHIGIDDPWIPVDFHEVRFSGVDPVGQKFPDHPILSISSDEWSERLGDRFAEDAERLQQIIGRDVPWAPFS